MIDTKTILDNVRSKIPGDAKLLVAYIDNNGILKLAQANSTQSDIQLIAESVLASIL